MPSKPYDSTIAQSLTSSIGEWSQTRSFNGQQYTLCYCERRDKDSSTTTQQEAGSSSRRQMTAPKDAETSHLQLTKICEATCAHHLNVYMHTPSSYTCSLEEIHVGTMATPLSQDAADTNIKTPLRIARQTVPALHLQSHKRNIVCVPTAAALPNVPHCKTCQPHGYSTDTQWSRVQTRRFPLINNLR